MSSRDCLIRFLRECLLNGVVPKWLLFRINRSKLKKSIAIESIFLKNEVAKNEMGLKNLHAAYKRHFDYLLGELTFTDFIDLLKFVTALSKKTKIKRERQNNKSLNFLKSQRYGNLKRQHVHNMSSYQLSEKQKLTLSLGLNFSLPVKKINREEVITSFEVFNYRMSKHVAISRQKEKVFKSTLGFLAHRYTNAKVDVNPCVPIKELRQSLVELKRNDSIIITKPDKGSGTVIMDKTEYLNKMQEIIQDNTKFEHIGPVLTKDKTAKREEELRKFLWNLVSTKEISEDLYKELRPVGSQRPRLYGLPKTHKVGIPLRPILSMIGSPQHKLAKYLNFILEPVTAKFSEHTIKDSFDFAKIVRSTSGSNNFMASFDVCSLFTNVPLMETINICAENLFEENNKPMSKETFIQLMQLATSSTEFSMNNEMYRQKDGVAMGSPLGPTLANIFMGHLETEYFKRNGKPMMYYRYVDDCFILFKNVDECMQMFSDFNGLHPAISFTKEVEENNCLAFLDVLVSRKDDKLITSLYRKKTFSGQYVNYLSHCSRRRKINLIKTLCHRAIMICSQSTLDEELKKITTILCDNGYPETLITRTFTFYKEKISQTKESEPEDRTIVAMKLPYVGLASTALEKDLRLLTRQCYRTVEPRVIFTSKPMLSHVCKDRIPMNDTSMVVYHFECCCGDSYVGHTVRRLGARIKEHVPACVIKHYKRQPLMDFAKNKTLLNAAKGSAVAEHLLKNPKCGLSLDRCKFTILHKCTSTFRLKILESVVIAAKEPKLCKQTEFDFVTSFI